MSEHRPLVRVTQQILNRPLCVTADHAATIIAAVRSELNIRLFTDLEGNRFDTGALDRIASQGRHAADMRKTRRMTMTRPRSSKDSEPKIFDFDSGIATIPIQGTLAKNWGLDPYSGMTGYDGIKAKLGAAYDDPDVTAILLDIDSPGGVVAGCMDLADLVYAVNAEKPVWSISNEQMCSAAFALGSQGSKLFTTRTADVGSVGVIWLYTNEQQAMEQEGVQVRVFKAGANKAEGNPYEPLSDETAARIQKTLDDMREIFIETVARGRGLSKKAVRETEALSYAGSDARDIGFATDIASADQVWSKMVDRFGR